VLEVLENVSLNNMFEQPVGKVEKDRSRLIIVVSGIAVILVVGLIVAVSSLSSKEAAKIEMSLGGSPEFDGYAQFVTLSDIEHFEGERLNNRYARITCKLNNTGEKSLVGVQLRMAIIGQAGDVLKEKFVTPIPTTHDSLKPNQTIRLELFMEPIPDPVEIMTFTVEVVGLKLK
jgi:hypothetical protein